MKLPQKLVEYNKKISMIIDVLKKDGFKASPAVRTFVNRLFKENSRNVKQTIDLYRSKKDKFKKEIENIAIQMKNKRKSKKHSK